MTLISREKHLFLSRLEVFFSWKINHFYNIVYYDPLSLFISLPTIFFHPVHHNSSDTLGNHSHLKSHHLFNQSFIFPLAIIPSPPILVFSNCGNGCSESLLWSKSGRSFYFLFFFQVSPSLLTLHIYTDGLDGSHPHPVVGLAVVATPLHSLDALDAQCLVVNGCFLELV